MPSEQATAAAGKIVELIDEKLFDYPRMDEVPEIAAIIDAALAPVVAELVSLLRMGRELAEASRDSMQGTPYKVSRAIADVNRILGQYDAAIAKHGGG